MDDRGAMLNTVGCTFSQNKYLWHANLHAHHYQATMAIQLLSKLPVNAIASSFQWRACPHRYLWHNFWHYINTKLHPACAPSLQISRYTRIHRPFSSLNMWKVEPSFLCDLQSTWRPPCNEWGSMRPQTLWGINVLQLKEERTVTFCGCRI